MRSFTFACPPKPVRAWRTRTQPLLEVAAWWPVQPSAVTAACPPGPALIEASLNQLFASPLKPTLFQVAPLSVEDCNTAQSMLRSACHHTFISICGLVKVLKLQQGPNTTEFSELL